MNSIIGQYLAKLGQKLDGTLLSGRNAYVLCGLSYYLQFQTVLLQLSESFEQIEPKDYECPSVKMFRRPFIFLTLYM